jgi:tetratricopeptide (TPR) repeat protein
MRARPRFLAGLAAVATIALAAGTQPTHATEGVDARIAAAFGAAYNLDMDEALAHANAAAAAGPDVSRAHRTVASVVWLQTLLARGAVTVDHYMGGLTRQTLNLPKPPPHLEVAFRTAAARAIETAEGARRRNPRDISALHDLGTAYGLQASWTASVEGRIMSAFGIARRAFDAEEEVLRRDPTRASAGTVVGTYRYAVANLGFASRMIAYVAGFGGDKAKALALLEKASRSGDATFEARTALVLIYSREGRHREAYALLGQMTAAYPRNRVLVLEQGSAAIRAGLGREAEAILTRGLAGLDRDDRRKMPGERALWLYKRGLSRLQQNHRTEAAADFSTAMASQPELWISGRLHLEMGKLADLAGRRADALSRYRLARDTARAANDPANLMDAERLLQRPFVLGRG